MPPLFSSATITRFANEAEDIFAREKQCIIERETIAITSGTHTYTLPDYIIDIRKITWKGKKLDPLSFQKLRNNLDMVSTGTPDSYIYDNISASQIRFFPIPNENITSITTDLYGSEILNRVIIEYYRNPDHSIYIIPPFFRRRLLKSYINRCCFSIEGSGQNLKAAKYWDNKWNYLKEQYGNLLEDLINEPRRIIMGGNAFERYVLPTPQLPYEYRGIGVDKGE
jgi:hypothetical protein